MTEIRKRIIRYFALPLRQKLHIVNKLEIWEDGDSDLSGVDQDKAHLMRAMERGVIEKVWEIVTTLDRQNEIDRLEKLEAEFEAMGGRGVDLAEEIDQLRTSLYPDEEPRLVHNLRAEGLDIQVMRSPSGILVVDIATSDLEEADTHVSTGVPNIRIMVNEGPIRFNPDGSLTEEYEEE